MIVVTGSSGFIGRHLVDRLVADDRPVVGIDRRPAPGVAGSGRARHRAIVADLAEPSSVLRHMLGTASAVVHLAACPGVRDVAPGIAGRRWRDNVLATRHVVAATPADTPLVVASSSSVYGGTVGGRASREDDALCPIGGYARSKVMVERIAAERGAAGGAVTVVRPFTVVGPGQRPDMALSRWIDAAVAGRPLQVYGSLDRHRRDVTDVADVVEALLRLVDLAPPTTVNVGTGESRSLGELVAAVQRIVGDTGMSVGHSPVAEPPATLADTVRCRELLGFTPATDLDAVVLAQAATVRRRVA